MQKVGQCRVHQNLVQLWNNPSPQLWGTLLTHLEFCNASNTLEYPFGK